MGLRGASLLLGIVWAAWHLPLFFLAGTDKTGQSFPLFAAGVHGALGGHRLAATRAPVEACSSP